MTDKELWEKSQVWDSSDDGRGKLKILESVEKFADLIRADERNRAMRENASKVCKDEGDDGWSDWVCPDPKGYLMKCCDCGLIHEAEFGVVRYKSETEREDCDMVNDPNLQAVFRMRRSEQWSPKDTAYRPGGMAQPEQELVCVCGAIWEGQELVSTPPQRKPLTEEEIERACVSLGAAMLSFTEVARAIEAAHGIKENIT